MTALLGIAAGVGAVLLLHVLRPDRSLVSDRLSEYASGSYGWLMVAAFWSVGIGVVAFAVATLAVRRDLIGRLAGVVAAVAGIGLMLSALYPTGVSPTAERVHSFASGLAAMALVTLAVGWSMLAVEHHRRAGPAGLAAAAAVAAVASTIAHDTPWTGLVQRTLWALLATWLLTAAWHRGFTTPSTADPEEA